MKNSFFVCLLSLLLISCNTTKFLDDNQLLLKKNIIVVDNPDLSKSDLYSVVRPTPNKKILGIFPFYLYVYNLTKNSKNQKIKNKINEIVGEPPAVVNEYDIKFSKNQLTYYLRSKGYYYCTVHDSIKIVQKKKAHVIYNIKTGKPYIIDSILYEFNPPTIKDYKNIILENTLLKKGLILDEDLLQNERLRITSILKNNGFYYFTKDFIQYLVDTSLGNYKVFIKVQFIGDYLSKAYKQYRIDSIFVFPNYNPKLAIEEKNKYFLSFDTSFYNNIYIISNKNLFHSRLLDRMNFILPGYLYNEKDAELTYNKFNSLNNFKIVNILFNENSNNRLNAYIQLTPLPKQSYKIELEGTNSSGNLGIAGNILYRNVNLFKGAQIFDLKVQGSIERQTAVIQENNEQIQSYLPFNSSQGNILTSLKFPSFVFPFISDNFNKYKRPYTQFQFSYNYQQRPDFSRTITSFIFGYEWFGNKNLKHFINPIQIDYVQIPFISWRFSRLIRGTFLENSYQKHLETISSYGFIFNDNKVGRYKNNSIYVRGNFESSGNLLNLYFNHTKPNDSVHLIAGIPFSQYIRSEIDLRYYKILFKTSKIVYRFYTGAGLPYGNSKTLPFNKQFFSGGSNSIRAWAVRSLGPGSYFDSLNSNIFNQTADIKLEANFEYRFKLIWVLEPALFVDVGNIWDIKPKENREGGLFKFNKFYKDIAIGYGAGIRFDFGFFIFRFDFALKGKDPAEAIDNRWLFIQRKPRRDDYSINIGIGYPF